MRLGKAGHGYAEQGKEKASQGAADLAWARLGPAS